MNSCELCLLVANLKQENRLLKLNDSWTVNSYQGQMLRPRLVLQSIKHITSFAKLSGEDYSLLGEAIKLVEQAMKDNPIVEKIYLESYNETGGHIHIHITPRVLGEEKLGPELEDKTIPDFTSDSIMGVLKRLRP